jgi:hypothetical protein
MAFGEYEGSKISDSKIRDLFDRKTVMASDWYKARLHAKLARRKRTLSFQIASLEKFLKKEHYASEAKRLDIQERLKQAQERLDVVNNNPKDYLDGLNGTLGLDVSFEQG